MGSGPEGDDVLKNTGGNLSLTITGPGPSFFLTHFHELQGPVSNGVEMRWSLVPPLVAVVISHDLSVDHQPLVGIDADAEQSRVGVNLQYVVSVYTFMTYVL